MGDKQDREAAVFALLAEMRTYYALGLAASGNITTAVNAAAAVMLTVSENTITAQQVTDLNAAITTLQNNTTNNTTASTSYLNLIQTYSTDLHK